MTGRILDRGYAEGVFRRQADAIDVHLMISSFCFFRDVQPVHLRRHLRRRPARQRAPRPVPADGRGYGKRSVVLDLRDQEDRRRMEELLATADVFISNLRPDALDKLDLEAEATVARHPHLVYCSISGYGLQGEERNRPTYDIGAFWARSGLSSDGGRKREPAERPGRHRRPHHRAGRPVRHPGRGDGAATHRRGSGGRDLAVADRRLCARLGSGTADAARQGVTGRVPAPQPVAADEPVPGRRREVVLPDRTRGQPAHRLGGACARPTRTGGGRTILQCFGHPSEPYRVHRHPGRGVRRATAGRVGRTVRPRGRVVGSGPDTGRGGRRPAVTRQRRLRRRGGRCRAIGQRPGDLLRCCPAGVGGCARTGRGHRRGVGRSTPGSRRTPN